MAQTRTPDAAAPQSPRFYAIHAGLPALAMVVLAVVFQVTDLDRALSDLFYDPGARQFPLRYAWFLEVVLHQWAKYLLVVIGCGTLAGFVASFGVPALRAQRRTLLFVFLAMALSPLAVGALKEFSTQQCPHNLEMYGGYAPQTRGFDPAPPGIKAGQCSPSGHASGGFGLMAFYFVWYRRRRRAYAALAAGFTYGSVLGFGRILQGAHFLSHILWSAVVVWFVILLLYRLILSPALAGKSALPHNDAP